MGEKVKKLKVVCRSMYSLSGCQQDIQKTILDKILLKERKNVRKENMALVSSQALFYFILFFNLENVQVKNHHRTKSP